MWIDIPRYLPAATRRPRARFVSGEAIVRVAVLGAASFAEVAHIPGVNAHPRAEVVALYSRSLGRAREMAERCGVETASDDLDALLARDDIAAVTIASSNDQHHPYAMAALRAGKHVFCEKPMALAEAEASEMTREAMRRGLVHQIAFIFRHTYCLQELRRLVQAGEIGTPFYISMHGERITVEGAGVRNSTWRDDSATQGAGQVGEMGSHFIDTANFVCGQRYGFITDVASVVHTPVREVRAGDRVIAVDTPDLASILFRTEQGVQGNILTSKATPAPAPYATIHGQPGVGGHMGYIIVTGERGALMASFSRGGGESLRRLEPGSDAWEPLPLPPEASDGQPHAVQRMMGSFIDSIIRGSAGDVAATFEDGYRSQAAVDAVMRASASRSWERVATGLDPGERVTSCQFGWSSAFAANSASRCTASCDPWSAAVSSAWRAR